MENRPIILIVDDRPHGVAKLLDALGRRYGSDYRVVGHVSAHAALDELARANVTGEDVALVIADQWMPEMTGSELLLRAHELHPEAQRALIVGWGDTAANETILQGCARGVLDNYILKPWAPPEVYLYPVVGEFLAEWARTHVPALELVRVVVRDPSPRGVELRDLLERNGIPHGYYDIASERGTKLAAEAGIDRDRLPAIITFDGRVLHNPTNPEIADALGAPVVEETEADLVIVGAGPCGLASAVYASSEGLRTIVVESEAPGGQAGTSSLIRNFLGFPRGISGADLAQRAYQQAWLFGAKYRLARTAIGLRTEGNARIVRLDDGRELTAKAVLIATGAEYRRLGVPRIERFDGAGVFYTAGIDHAIALRGEDVVVYGGGNSAGQAVVHLAKTAHRVFHIVRGSTLAANMSAYLVDHIARLPNVETHFSTEVIDADGEPALQRVTLRDASGATRTIESHALFVMIGARPHTQWLEGVVARERSGFILTGSDLVEHSARLHETSMPGVFAAGDVRWGSTKRLASAVGEGAVAVRMIQDFLRER